jgi:hypothetical protein
MEMCHYLVCMVIFVCSYLGIHGVEAVESVADDLGEAPSSDRHDAKPVVDLLGKWILGVLHTCTHSMDELHQEKDFLLQPSSEHRLLAEYMTREHCEIVAH